MDNSWVFLTWKLENTRLLPVVSCYLREQTSYGFILVYVTFSNFKVSSNVFNFCLTVNWKLAILIHFWQVKWGWRLLMKKIRGWTIFKTKTFFLDFPIWGCRAMSYGRVRYRSGWPRLRRGRILDCHSVANFTRLAKFNKRLYYRLVT